VTPATELVAPVCSSTHCITCGDVAVEMLVVAVDEDRLLALCEAGDGARETVEVALVASVRPGDRLLVHAGTAIARAGAGL
jgi:hydrogenase maturation factor